MILIVLATFFGITHLAFLWEDLPAPWNEGIEIGASILLFALLFRLILRILPPASLRGRPTSTP